MIRGEVSASIDRSIEEVFAFVDDVSKSSQWLSQCVSLRQASSATREDGTQLHYTYRQGNKTGEMEGIISSRIPGNRLAMVFQDKAFTVELHFLFSADGHRTTLKHCMGIQPKCLSMKIMSPVIALATRRQMKKDIEKLKMLLEAQ